MKKLLFVLILCVLAMISGCSGPAYNGSTSSAGADIGSLAETQTPADGTPDNGESSSAEVLPDKSDIADAGDNSVVHDPADSSIPETADPDGSADVAPSEEEQGDSGSDVPVGGGNNQEAEEIRPSEEPQQPAPFEFPEVKLNGIPVVNIVTASDATINRDEYINCAIAVIDPTGTFDTVSDVNATIKVRGHSSAHGDKKPYNFKFESKQEVLGLGKGKKWALLANMYDKTQLRNLLAFELARDIGMPYIQQSIFVEVYLNGEYRGIYQLCEPVDVDKTKVDIDKNGNEALLEVEPRAGYSNEKYIKSPHYKILLGFNEPEVPTDAQMAYYKEFLGTAEKAMASGSYAEVCKYVDVASFANAYVVQELFKQVDYTTTSTRFYIKDGKLYEGPVWDFDLSSGNCSSSLYPAYNNTETTGLSWQGIYCVGLWNQYLFQYEEFRTLVSQRLMELQPIIVNLYQDNELGRNQIDSWLDEYREDIERNNSLWLTKKKYSTYEHKPVDGTYDAEIEFLRDWLKNRNEWLLDYYCTT